MNKSLLVPVQNPLIPAGARLWETNELTLNQRSVVAEKTEECGSFVINTLFVRVSGLKLGLTEITRTHEVWAKAIESGLSLCVPEDARFVREQYQSQPKNDFLWLAMPQFRGWSNEPVVLRLVHNGTMKVTVDSCPPWNPCKPETEFLYRCQTGGRR